MGSGTSTSKPWLTTLISLFRCLLGRTEAPSVDCSYALIIRLISLALGRFSGGLGRHLSVAFLPE